MDRERFLKIRAAAQQSIAARKMIDHRWCHGLGRPEVLRFSSVESFMAHLGMPANKKKSPRS